MSVTRMPQPQPKLTFTIANIVCLLLGCQSDEPSNGSRAETAQLQLQQMQSINQQCTASLTTLQAHVDEVRRQLSAGADLNEKQQELENLTKIARQDCSAVARKYNEWLETVNVASPTLEGLE